MQISFFRIFLGERILSLILNIRVKSFPWKTLYVCRTFNLLIIFSINTTYKQLPCWFLNLCHKILENLYVMEKWLSYSYLAEEKLTANSMVLCKFRSETYHDNDLKNYAWQIKSEDKIKSFNAALSLCLFARCLVKW